MHLYHTATIHTYRQFEQLIWLSVKAASLARHAQPGQVALVRHSQPGLDPLLWTTLFLAGADPATGTVEFLIDPRDPAVIWLSDLSPGTALDLCVPGGKHFSLKPTTQTLLLAGTGAAYRLCSSWPASRPADRILRCLWLETPVFYPLLFSCHRQ